MVDCPEGILSKDFLIQRDNKNVGGAVYAARDFQVPAHQGRRWKGRRPPVQLR